MARELGSTGLNVHSGIVDEEFLTQLRGERGWRVFREMADNDATVGAILAAVELLLRPITWRTVAKDSSAEARVAAEFADTLLWDMEMSWEDTISEVLSMLTYGWSFHEVVLKRREVGSSRWPDGMIGVARLAPRAQTTLARWEVASNGDILGLWQYVDHGGEVFIPMGRAVLFRTTSRRNNPEGRSMLRNAYRSWYFLKRAQESESIGIERELAGLPVVRIPAAVLSSAEADDVAVRRGYEKIARDLKFNEQGGIVIPSDVFLDQEGRPVSGARKVDVELLTTGGTRSINTNDIITRYERNIARSILADFVMLGTDGGRGSYALSQDKSSLFLRSCETVTWQVASTLNQQLLPAMMRINGMDPALSPSYEPGKVSPPSMEQLGTYLRNLSQAGFVFASDPAIVDHLRDAGGLPTATSTPVGI